MRSLHPAVSCFIVYLLFCVSNSDGLIEASVLGMAVLHFYTSSASQSSISPFLRSEQPIGSIRNCPGNGVCVP